MALPQGLSIYANGVNIAGAVTSFEPTGEREALDATALADTYRVFEQGMKNGTVSLSGIFEYDQTNEDKIHNVFSAAFDDRSEVIFTASYAALAVGGSAVLVDGVVLKYGNEVLNNQIITCSAELQSSEGINAGVWLFNASVNNTSSNGSSVDNSASTANGGLFHVHTQNSSGNDVNVVLQHSTDGSTWADLAEVDVSGAIGSASSTVAAGTTVNRYLRAQVTTTGGAATVQAAFARR
jgi:hypothetical protein